MMKESDLLLKRSAFLQGDKIYLRSPDIKKDVISGDWYSWFNDKETTKYLHQGVWPNTIEKQVAFVESLKEDQTRILLCIIEKETSRHIGVVSLYNIDIFNQKSDISIVMGAKKYPVEAPLEAMALMVEHGFDRLNLLKINAGMVDVLWKWINVLELIGFQIEGFIEYVFVRDGNTYHGVQTGVSSKSFYRLREERGGCILTKDTHSLLKTRRKNNIIPQVQSALQKFHQE
ncbi:MAG: GNAT family N-acetyltransferase [Candidatus Brocadiaceae bacterium]|nr:GNAT family N-acetyltransferase [Candidatus Brocadiaceae bacterium]